MLVELTPNEVRVLKDTLEYDILAQLDVAQAVGLDKSIDGTTGRTEGLPVDEDDIRVMYYLYVRLTDTLGVGCSSVVQNRYRAILDNS